MKKVLFLAAVVCLTQILFAQEEIERKGDTALQFGFNSTTLIRGGNYGVGGKYWLKDDLALMIGLSVTDQSKKQEYPDRENYGDLHYDKTVLGIAAGFEKHFKPTKKISPYYGAILVTNMARNKNNQDSPVKYDNKYVTWGLGAGLLLGVEYWITDSVSLAGTHYIKMLYDRNKQTQTANNLKDEQKESSWTINSSTSLLMISVYF